MTCGFIPAFPQGGTGHLRLNGHPNPGGAAVIAGGYVAGMTAILLDIASSCTTCSAEAAEIEHNLMCCYLYAAFSLKDARTTCRPKIPPRRCLAGADRVA